MIRLFINLYNSDNKARQQELDFCYKKNSENKWINQIHCLYGRPSFADFFSAASIVASDNDLTIVGNTDIYYDETIALAEKLKSNECYALTRHEWTPKGITFPLKNHNDCQDVWIFRGKIKPMNANFKLGTLGCDNTLARRIADAGYSLSNPASKIRAIHVHASNYRTYKEADRLPPSGYLFVPQT